jgi:hypothetical protein
LLLQPMLNQPLSAGHDNEAFGFFPVAAMTRLHRFATLIRPDSADEESVPPGCSRQLLGVAAAASLAATSSPWCRHCMGEPPTTRLAIELRASRRHAPPLSIAQVEDWLCVMDRNRKRDRASPRGSADVRDALTSTRSECQRGLCGAGRVDRLRRVVEEARHDGERALGLAKDRVACQGE